MKSGMGLVRQLARFVHEQSPSVGTESVFFFSLHKCATTLFADYVLPNVEGFKQIDYQKLLYLDQLKGKIQFEKYGHLYGVIRLSARPGSLEHEQIVKKVATGEFVKDKSVVFLIRDPRDILVSQYYSFGFTHGRSPNEAIRLQQEKRRASIQAKSVDAYAQDTAPELQGYFEILRGLSVCAKRSALWRYEDLVLDFDQFMSSFTQWFRISDALKEQLFLRSRPRETEHMYQHKRSGRVGGYKEKLKPETIAVLNAVFGPTLERYGYDR
jgi:hypothetical protein